MMDEEEETTEINDYTPLECFVAGYISARNEFANRHPTAVLPLARAAIQAVNLFKPSHGG